MPRTLQIKDPQFEQRIFMRRAVVAAICLVAFVFLLGGRLVYLQILRHDYYLDLSQGNRARIEPIPANRGLILDRKGKVLVENQPAYQLELIREQVPDLNSTLKGLAELDLIPKDEIGDVRKLVMSRRGFEGVPIRLRMSEDEIARFAVHRYEFPGVDIQTRSTRFYPHGDLAVHALGYVAAISEQDLARIDRSAYSGTSLIGKLGVEAARESELHGTNGFREILVNTQGRSVDREDDFGMALRKRAPKAGSDLILSIDLAAQQAAEEGLAGKRGAVVAIDPNTGDVLALASRPGFDPGLFARGVTRAEYRELAGNIDLPLINRALAGIYPPGSTVKPVIAMAGLSYGVIRENDTKYCPGVYHLANSRRIAREGRTGVHGWVNMEEAIAKSCDVYFYGLAADLGVDRIHDFLDPFGFGKPTGIDISGEKSGLLPSQEWKRRAFKKPEDQVWFPGETVNFGIGQGYMSVTPIQLAQVTSVLAARGSVFKPRLVTALRDSESGQLTTVAPIPLPHVKGGTPEQWQTVFNGMEKTLTIGTARYAITKTPYTIAGKTGTAQAFSVAQNARYVEKDVDERLRDHSWFVAFAPADAPRIAVAVLVENGGFGSAVAAPIARKVMDAYLLPLLAAEGVDTEVATPAPATTRPPAATPGPGPHPPAISTETAP